MDAGGAGRLNRSSPSCLNRPAQRTDFFHGLLKVALEDPHSGGVARTGWGVSPGTGVCVGVSPAEMSGVRFLAGILIGVSGVSPADMRGKFL